MALSFLAHATACLLLMLLFRHLEPLALPNEVSVALLFEQPAPQTQPSVADATPLPPPDAVAPSITEQSRPNTTPPIVPASPPAPAPLPATPEPSQETQLTPKAPSPPAQTPSPRQSAQLHGSHTPPHPPAPAETRSAAIDNGRTTAVAPLVPPRPVAGMEANQAPSYPEIARRRGEEGRVMLRVNVSADGTPLDVELAETSGHPRLDSAALAAVRRWRFLPATQAGRPVPAMAEVPIRFRLDN